jgi:hypothetical protein
MSRYTPHTEHDGFAEAIPNTETAPDAAASPTRGEPWLAILQPFSGHFPPWRQKLRAIWFIRERFL